MLTVDLHPLLYTVFQSHWRLSTKEFSQLNLTSAQPKILHFLSENGEAKQVDIGDGCNLDSATVTIILKKMEQSKLIIRKIDEQDRRIVRVYLTEKGQGLIGKIDLGYKKIEELAFKGFSKEEIKDLKTFLKRMGDNLLLAEERA